MVRASLTYLNVFVINAYALSPVFVSIAAIKLGNVDTVGIK
jgi:hypothetical protein